MDLLPNLGAEEGDDWRAFQREPAVRTAARLWRLLYPHDACLRVPSPGGAALAPDPARWPADLGPPATTPALAWLGADEQPTPWLATATLEAQAGAQLGRPLAGPPPAVVAELNDKAFAVRAARELGLVPRALDALVEVLEPADLRDADALVARLQTTLQAWPAWTGRRFTLKPRFGTSGRGRVAGRESLDTPAVRGALARLERSGGAIFEPWLERQTDLAVALHVPGNSSADALPVVVGSMELITTASGLHRGHCGELDARGRIFSGHPVDETLRADAAAIAARVAERGYRGPSGVDAFTYREDGRERLRSVVELNARPTMGLVAIGLVRRALAAHRERLRPEPGARHGWLFTLVPPTEAEAYRAWLRDCGDEVLALELDVDPEEERARAPRPILAFGPDATRLRAAHRAHLGC